MGVIHLSEYFNIMYKDIPQESLSNIIIGGSLAFLLLAGFVVFFFIIYIRRKYHHIQEKQRMQSSFKEELLRTRLEIQEQTLQTISEEIHDNIGQALSLAKLKLNTLDYLDQDKLRSKTTDAKELVSKAIQDLRDLSRSLNTDAIASQGLVSALEQELEMYRRTDFKAELLADGPVPRLEPQKELIIFRIIQESLNNISKHADAGQIRVIIKAGKENLEIRVEDNGKGFDPGLVQRRTENTKSLGLRNMANRAAMIGADFRLCSEPGKGTIVILTLPLNKN